MKKNENTNKSEICKVLETENLIAGYLTESHHFCSACLEGYKEIRNLLQQIQKGFGAVDDLKNLERQGKKILDSCKCTAGRETARIFLDRLDQFREDFLIHVKNKYCATGDCVHLIAAPCQLACPANVDAPSYVALVGKGRYKEAMEVLMEDLPFPGTLGRICVHPCERACRRGEVDQPIAICQLKRVAFDKAYEQGFQPPAPAPNLYEEKVAIVGSGPAGLSVAYFLAKTGYRATIFESMSEPGGMLRWGIPAFRLPREVVSAEIGYIKALGVEIRVNATLGEEITLRSLKEEGYKAIFLGIGAWRSMDLGIPREKDFSGVQDCLHFLHQAAQGKAEVGKRVIVLGGGNAAVDCVRTALRLDTEEVHLVYRRSRLEMPAHREEVEAAEQEGAILDFLLSPIRVHGEDGKVSGLECIRNRLSEPDASGRRRPVPIKGTERVIHADVIIKAIGQEVNIVAFEDNKDVEFSNKHLLVVNPLTMQTSLPGVFAGGDVVTGPATVVEAVAAGKKAAESIHRYIRKIPYSEKAFLPFKRRRVPVLEVTTEEKSLSDRPAVKRRDFTSRVENFEEVDFCLSRENASQEAKRCLRCDICIGCGRCIEVCRDFMGIEAIHLSYVDENGTEETNFLRPTERCIGCGSCVINCPTGAITMQDTNGERKIMLCGTEMSRHPLVKCISCGLPFIPGKHLHFVRDKADLENSLLSPSDLCPECARREKAKSLAGAFA